MVNLFDQLRVKRGLAVLAGVDAVLVAVLLVVLTLSLTGQLGASAGSAPGAVSGASTSGASSASASPGASSGPTATTAALEAFALPSGNIACTMSADGARCTIASITFTPPADATCTGTSGHEYAVDSTGVHMPCVDGPVPGVAPSSTPILEYGASSRVGGYSCTSATDGVTCVEVASGVGFRLARAAYAALP